MSLTREQLIEYLNKDSETISTEEAKAIIETSLTQISEKLCAPEPHDVWLRKFNEIKSRLLLQARTNPSFIAKFGVTSTFPGEPDTNNQPSNQSGNSPTI